MCHRCVLGCRKLTDEQPISVADGADVTIACGGMPLWLSSSAGATALGDNSRLTLLGCQVMLYKDKAAAEELAAEGKQPFGQVEGGTNSTLQLQDCTYFAQGRVRPHATSSRWLQTLSASALRMRTEDCSL